MASAGRILIIPKGNYDDNTNYTMLDMVYHNGTTWIAKKDCVGIEPSNAHNEHWQNMFDLMITKESSGGTLITDETNGVTTIMKIQGGQLILIKKVGNETIGRVIVSEVIN